MEVCKIHNVLGGYCMKKLFVFFTIFLLITGFAFARGAQEVEIIDIEEEEEVDEFEGITAVVHDGWEQGRQ